MGLGLKVHDGHGLGLEHDLSLGVAQAISLVGITSSRVQSFSGSSSWYSDHMFQY